MTRNNWDHWNQWEPWREYASPYHLHCSYWCLSTVRGTFTFTGTPTDESMVCIHGTDPWRLNMPNVSRMSYQGNRFITIMVWLRTFDRPVCEPLMSLFSLLTFIYTTVCVDEWMYWAFLFAGFKTYCWYHLRQFNFFFALVYSCCIHCCYE